MTDSYVFMVESLPSAIISSVLTFWSLNKPEISTLQPYTPASLLWTLRMVRESSPAVTRPSSWYLGDLLKTTPPSWDERTVLEHLNKGTFPCPQQKRVPPSVGASYVQGKVTFCPIRPMTLLVQEDAVKGWKWWDYTHTHTHPYRPTYTSTRRSGETKNSPKTLTYLGSGSEGTKMKDLACV